MYKSCNDAAFMLISNCSEIAQSNVCFQGQFSINLIGTGLKVSEATKWTSQGNYVSVKVHRSEVRSLEWIFKQVVLGLMLFGS